MGNAECIDIRVEVELVDSIPNALALGLVVVF
jgi:hypothetical protein